jgi:hypothetical protein
MNTRETIAALKDSDAFWTVRVTVNLKPMTGKNEDFEAICDYLKKLGQFNRFDGAAVVKELRKLAYKHAYEIAVGNEYSPVLYVTPIRIPDGNGGFHVSKEAATAIKLAMKRLKADELHGDEIIRAWWD